MKLNHDKHVIKIDGREVWCWGDVRYADTILVACNEDWQDAILSNDVSKYRNQYGLLSLQLAWVQLIKHLQSNGMDQVEEITVEYPAV